MSRPLLSYVFSPIIVQSTDPSTTGSRNGGKEETEEAKTAAQVFLKKTLQYKSGNSQQHGYSNRANWKKKQLWQPTKIRQLHSLLASCVCSSSLFFFCILGIGPSLSSQFQTGMENSVLDAGAHLSLTLGLIVRFQSRKRRRRRQREKQPSIDTKLTPRPPAKKTFLGSVTAKAVHIVCVCNISSRARAHFKHFLEATLWAMPIQDTRDPSKFGLIQGERGEVSSSKTKREKNERSVRGERLLHSEKEVNILHKAGANCQCLF